jgi:hypothetical protein
MDKTIEKTPPIYGGVSFDRVRLPEDFLLWQSQARFNMFQLMEQKGAQAISMAPVHLPVLASLGNGSFPINLSTRGIGVLPRQEYIEEFTEKFRSALSHVEMTQFSESLRDRVSCAKEFYSAPDLFDPHILGGLEIFEGQTSKNLMKNPKASLLYTGEAPKFPSYQLNGVISFVESGDPHYEFLLAARKLFAFDSFHIKQKQYPYGYIFHVTEIKNKTPFPRK